MSDFVIRAHDLSKLYRIGGGVDTWYNYKSLGETITNFGSRIAKSLRFAKSKSGNGNTNSGTLWALKDVSFEVRQGDVIGIIGRNGAGKSTLLKILSRITEPTEGLVEIRGRVGSLLEVGTGFHPELTGRENIYLNGAILGMKKAEIKRKFDEIVAFSEIEKFLDTPVKFYSTGMHVRLAFSVAAHLEPEILLVDEVLAVGDAAFQKKCLGKMGKVARAGRTVFLVSHNMEAIQRICQKGMLLANGKLLASGSAESVVDAYLSSLPGTAQTSPVFAKDSPFTSICLKVGGQLVEGPVVWKATRPLEVSVTVKCLQPLPCPRVDIAFFRGNGLKIFEIHSDQALHFDPGDLRKHWRVDFRVAELALATQTLFLDISVRKQYCGEDLVLWQRACEILVDAGGSSHGLTEDSLVSPTIEVSSKA